MQTIIKRFLTSFGMTGKFFENRHYMNLISKKLAFPIIAVLMAIMPLSGQQYKDTYGNIPRDYVAYDKYQKAYKYHFLEPIGFYGAGREEPPPSGLKEIRLGFLGPLEGSVIVSYGKQMLNGATLAIEEANNKGGYRGIPFKMMIHNDVGLWGAAANEVVKMDDEGVWAWLGSIDDIVSHVAIRATLKLEIPMVCTGDPDPTFTETNIPWVVRVIPDDRQSCYALANYIFELNSKSRIAVIRVNNRYGRVGTVHFNKTATRLGYPIIIEERFNDGETVFAEQIGRIKNSKPDAILIWGNPKESALILQQLRGAGLGQPVYCSDRIVNPVFLQIAGNLADGIVTTCQYNPQSGSTKYLAFKEAYNKRFGIDPDVFAVHAFDGMNIIIESVRKAGPNRVLIRDLLTDMKTFQNYEGASGKIIFDATWNNIRPIYMARISNGKFEFSPAPPYKKELQ
jgi:branched-chain amino acid transport system substrate-binding protein